ncbi:unnamed protein product [Calypogeia fissa]
MGLLMKVETVVAIIAITVALAPFGARAGCPLSTSFYAETCPHLEHVVNKVFQAALRKDPRIGASLLRVHFHDCFVQGCDGSIALVDTPTFIGEQHAIPNNNSIRGFDVLEAIKTAVEGICPNTVSCADIIALVARIGTVSAGGPYWDVEFGRRDSRTACLSCANTQLPSPFSNVSTLTAAFAAKGLNQVDMVALSGAHTFGKAHCGVFSRRLTNFSGTGKPDPTLNPKYGEFLLKQCPQDVSPNVVLNLDLTTPFIFDNAYYYNLFNDDGLLISDQSLLSEGGPTADLVGDYGWHEKDFFKQFVESIIKMGRISPLTGSEGEIHKSCSFVN